MEIREITAVYLPEFLSAQMGQTIAKASNVTLDRQGPTRVSFDSAGDLKAGSKYVLLVYNSSGASELDWAADLNGDTYAAGWVGNTYGPTGQYVYGYGDPQSVGADSIFAVYVKQAVQDTTPPVLTLPGTITAEATSSDGAAVDFAGQVSAFDDVDGNVPVTCSPSSGSIFPLGTTTVNCTAEDAAHNTATDSFKVTVQDTKAPSVNNPLPQGTKVLRTTKVSANFSEPVQIATLTPDTVQLFSGKSTKPLKASLDRTQTSVTLTPSTRLDAKTTYTVKIKGGASGVKDLAGNALANDYTWKFTTGSQ